MANDRDPESDPAAFLGAELARARLAAGIETQDQLARELGFDRTVITKAETGERAPSKSVAAALDKRFSHLNGLFGRLAVLARRSDGAIPRWFEDWLLVEREAASLSWWEPMLIPGLLQTEAYARAILAAAPDVTSENLDERVAVRLERQSVLDGPSPLELAVCLDGTVLRRCIGSAKVMHDQLEYLIATTDRRNITIQVVPPEVGTHGGLLGAFIVAGLDSSPSILYMEGALEGQVFEKPDLVRRANVIFNRLRADALPQATSRDLIMKAMDDTDG